LRRWLFEIGLLPIIGNKGYGLTWPGPLHKRIARRVGAGFIWVGNRLGADR
jgi:hypothetical protein